MHKKTRKMIVAILVFTLTFTSASVISFGATKKVNKLKITSPAVKEYKLPNKSKVKLKVSVSPKGASSKVTWSSSNKKIATVNKKGVVTAKKAGKVKITATSKSNKKIKATQKIKVVKPVKSIKITSPKSAEHKLNIGSKVTIKVKASPNGTNNEVNWKSSNKKIATVSNKGVVTAKAEGTVKITATSKYNKKAKATQKITVNPAAKAPRAFQDGFFETKAKSEEVYINNNNWTMYYDNLTWEDYLFNMYMIFAKGYDMGGSMYEENYQGNLTYEPDNYPSWFFRYADCMYLTDLSTQGIDSVTLKAKLDGWQTLEATFYFTNTKKTPGGMGYNATIKVTEVGADLLAGKAGPTISQDLIGWYDYDVYVEMKNRRASGDKIPRVLGDIPIRRGNGLGNYVNDSEWVIYNSTADWLGFLQYCTLLELKGYELGNEDGEMPDYLEEFFTEYPDGKILPEKPAGDMVTIIAYNPNWQEHEIEFFFDKQEEDGIEFTQKISVTWMHRDNINGHIGPGLPPDVTAQYFADYY